MDKRLIDELTTGRYLTDGRNVIFLGPSGVGKTMLAIFARCTGGGNGASCLLHNCHGSCFKAAGRELSNEINCTDSYGALQPHVLVIDEVGYLQLDRIQASLLFQVICNRYKRNEPIILTSNKSFVDGAKSLLTMQLWPQQVIACCTGALSSTSVAKATD